MDDKARIQYPGGAQAKTWLGGTFGPFLEGLHDAFGGRVHDLRHHRSAQLRSALGGTALEAPAPCSAVTDAWRVPELPEALCRPGIEISGPVSITSMAIHALNPGPGGERAVGYLDDDEDSGGHQLSDTLRAVANRCAALDGTLAHDDASRGKRYRVAPGALPFFMHRERGWHLDEPEVLIDRRPVSATLLGTGLTLFHVGRHHAALGHSIHFYLPKMESAKEAALYRDLFAHCKSVLPHLQGVEIRGIALIESLPAVWEMEEILHALGPFAAGLNAARWDLKASLLEFAMNDSNQVWPDRFEVDIKTTPFLSEIFRRLVAVCAKHGAAPIGGMATALPSKDAAVNAAAASAIRSDKIWEAEQGFLRGWVAHIHHMSTAAAPFQERWKAGFDPSELPTDPTRHPIRIERPRGRLTEDGTRRNLRTLLHYVQAWLQGRGAVAIDSLAGRPGKRPALMEDLATARISVAQTAQRLIHASVCEDTGRRHNAALVESILAQELESIRRVPVAPSAEVMEGHEYSLLVARSWIERYAELDFRSLGSFTRTELKKSEKLCR